MVFNWREYEERLLILGVPHIVSKMRKLLTIGSQLVKTLAQ